jgi:hypothetical protein
LVFLSTIQVKVFQPAPKKKVWSFNGCSLGYW